MCDNPQRAAAAAADLHRQGDDGRADGRQVAEIGDILEARDIVAEQDAVNYEIDRLSVIEARRVEADGADVALLEVWKRTIAPAGSRPWRASQRVRSSTVKR